MQWGLNEVTEVKKWKYKNIIIFLNIFFDRFKIYLEE